MRNLVFIIALAAFLIGYASATQVQACTDDPEAKVAPGTKLPDDLINITNCTKPPCRLRRKTTVVVQFKLQPTKDIRTLRNSVHAKIVGVPFPFIGVDGTNACNNIFAADGKTKAGCPLRANTEYVYVNNIKVLDIYPKIKVLVQWALVAEDNSKPVCFNVPAKITS